VIEMGENCYQAENRSISFSESADIRCLCTFPHNATSGGKFKPDAGRIMNLALLGCAVALLHNSSEVRSNIDDVLIPSSLGEYGEAIMSWFNSIEAETAAMRDIIGRLPNVSCCAWETLEENMGYGEGELQAKIDTVLGGK